MIIEESVLINADIKKIWRTFTDLTCWADWNTIATKAACRSGRIEEGLRFTFSIRPGLQHPGHGTAKDRRGHSQGKGRLDRLEVRHLLPPRVPVQAGVERRARDEPRDRFRGLQLLLARRTFPRKTIRELTVTMLQDLKKAAEK